MTPRPEITAYIRYVPLVIALHRRTLWPAGACTPNKTRTYTTRIYSETHNSERALLNERANFLPRARRHRYGDW